MWFLEEDTGGGSGGGETEVMPPSRAADVFGPISKGPEADRLAASKPATGDAPAPVRTSAPVRQTPTQAPATSTPEPAKAALSNEELAAIFGQAVAKHIPAPVAPVAAPAPPMSLEDAKKLLKFWEPSPEFLAKFGNLDTQQAAFQELRDGLFGQFTTVMQAKLEEYQQQLEARYGQPLTQLQQAEQQRITERAENEFYTSYPMLKNPQLQPIITAVAAGLRAEGKSFKTNKEVHDAIAAGVEAFGRQTNPEFKLANLASSTTDGNAPVKPTGNANPNAIAHSSAGGGGGGAGGGGGNVPELPKGTAVFGAISSKRK